jgi:uncharacterized protein
MDVQVELVRVVITELGEQQIIFLREKAGEKRQFPIVIGIHEAVAIDRRLKGIETPRPMTHELIDNLLDAMDVELDHIVISDLRQEMYGAGGTFIATLYLRSPYQDELIPVDARPSDSIAVGVAHDTPLYVSDHVIEQCTAQPPSTVEGRLDLLRKRLEVLSDRIEQFSELLGNEEFLDEAPEEIVSEHRRQLAEMNREYDAIEMILKKLG